MESKTLTIIGAGKQLLSMLNSHREMCHPVKAFQFFLVLSCTLFCLITCEPCAVNGMPKTDELDGCEKYGDTQYVGFQGTTISDSHPGYDAGTSMTSLSAESVCTDSYLFCFPSTLPGFMTEETTIEVGGLEVSRAQSDSVSSYVEQSNLRRQVTGRSWLSNHGMFKLLNGQTVSCSLYSRDSTHEFLSIHTEGANQNDISSCRQPLLSRKSTSIKMKKNKKITKLGSLDSLSSPNVEINPPILDWGRKFLFFPSVAYLTVANTCNDSILRIHEPFSTNKQFYPCNFSEISLGPGEVASVCFVFLPRWVGLSSAHLILQTSTGGFLVQAKGFAVESPYEIQPLVSLDIPSSGQLNKNLSLFNPFDETLYVEEITSWMSVSLGNSTHHTEAVCSMENFKGNNVESLLGAEDWLVMNGGKNGFPLMFMRPSRKWEINPQISETIIEIDLSLESKGKFFGAFCMQLQRSSQDLSDIVMVPLEVDLGRKASYDDPASSLSVSLEALVPYDGSETVFVAISLKNSAPYVLSFLKIDEDADAGAKVFHIKYMEGLLLYPGAVTQIAATACTKLPVEIPDSSSEVSNTINSCKLHLMTNESISPQIDVLCEDIIHICVEHQKKLSMANERWSYKVKTGNTRAEFLSNGMQLASWAQTAEVDELVLGNWKSQGTTGGMSVLGDHEVLFPMVQVGSQCSKWITVKNPSTQPVVMQLILNSGEIVDECRSEDVFMMPLSGSLAHNSSTIPMRHGFSIGESATIEAFVHPNSRASFGPILFHPSNRCGWTSSALIRNNLSGVEWLSLRGYGGSISLVLFEGSAPIKSVEFNLSFPTSLNISSPQMFFHMEETTYACSQPLSKELYAKNTGDLPLEVRSIEVSGTEGVVDGFTVHGCKGFFLEPGESTKLLISYQPDFSAALVHRDLELVSSTGIFVIPMKAALPLHMLNLCRKSVFWMRLKRFFFTILLSALLFLMFCLIFHGAMILSPQDYFYKSEKNRISTIPAGGESSFVDRDQRNGKFSVSAAPDSLLSSVEDTKSLKEPSNGRFPYGHHVRGNQEPLTNQNAKRTSENERDVNSFLDPQREISLSSFPSKSVVAGNPDPKESPQTGNLTIRIGKEKGRSRRKRKGGFKELIEVSSSQSGNSTPSSPLSPITSVTPNRTWLLHSDVEQSLESRNSLTHLADQIREKGKVPQPITKANVLGAKVSMEHGSSNWYSSAQKQVIPRKVVLKPVLSHSATFPCASMPSSSSPLASTSVIAPCVRAPGSKLSDHKNLKAERKGRVGDEYTYDIWGDHFSGLHLRGRSRDDVAVNSSIISENNSDSFFVRGPQTLMNKSQPCSVNQDG
ncbi:hypothetical protein F3Y22_tig00110569pilonHSYRG00260 [Hibiscus syriacus]|uniref:Uncharacterized protein n=1 Tax=Hibiscus syriacus TaxID=106335 RepID=A0A6A3A9X6_HIBSY|nr:uncharacterized protein LOC120132790 isoform X2 [Hibiscus syriacus]KAE8699985.1 hypothetical protein F3Y22_tig00110569pilonHSYRG00260 [Hibiscus syriacus]